MYHSVCDGKEGVMSNPEFRNLSPHVISHFRGIFLRVEGRKGGGVIGLVSTHLWRKKNNYEFVSFEYIFTIIIQIFRKTFLFWCFYSDEILRIGVISMLGADVNGLRRHQRQEWRKNSSLDRGWEGQSSNFFFKWKSSNIKTKSNPFVFLCLD